MNYYFFLDFPDKNFSSSLDIFNMPSNLKLCNDKIKDCYVNLFYSDGEKWVTHQYTTLKKFESKLIKKNHLPNHFQDKSVFLSYSFDNSHQSDLLKNIDYMNSNPDWRANICIYNSYTSTSYQGEYPGEFLNRKISLVSCTPMLQKNALNFFYLVNLQADPKIKSFELEIYDSYKNKIDEVTVYTNTINIVKLDKLKSIHKENMFIFISREQGGVPIYFSSSTDYKSLSLEHTHPPVEYLYWGERSYFQKNKKIFWFNNEK